MDKMKDMKDMEDMEDMEDMAYMDKNSKEEKVADNLLKQINTVAKELEDNGLNKESSVLHSIFIRLAKTKIRK